MELRQDRNAKLVIFRNDRNDTPHLTISWENPSKEIDIHLKSRSAGGQENHRKLVVIHERDFIKLFVSLKPIFLQSVSLNLNKIRRVRPGWLGHRGYAVFYMDEEEKSQMIDRIAPLRKYHGKWERVPDLKVFEDWIHSPEAINSIYHPSILHDIAADGCDDPIIAGRIRGQHKPKTMPLQLVKMPDGRSFWLRLDKLGKSMMGISETFTLSCLKLLLPGDAWATIFNELHLEEIGLELA
ncbi:MAG TPA: hypothetical protein VF723_05445 [Pyrinomonadaceae bacterium]